MEAFRDMLLGAGMPIHPAIVHVPLILAAVAPLAIVWLLWRAYRGGGTRRGWAVTLALQCAVVASGLLAQRTGESEEQRVRAAVPAWSLEVHERRATTFLIGAGVLLVMTAAVTAAPRAARAVAPVALLVSVAVAMLGVATGHAGGQLVYRHGAIELSRPCDTP